MISCIISDDEDDCVMVEVAENPTNPSKPKKTKKILKFERNLIAQVRKHRLLYDNKHKLFSNVAKKESVWEKIAKQFNMDVDVCKTTWIELRYSYQCHTRRLHKFFINGHKKNRKRPVMYFESELMFLWRFIENRKSCSLPFEIFESSTDKQAQNENVQFGTEDLVNQVIDDDLILVEAPVECIVIDEDEENNKTEKPFKVTSSMKKLIEQIKKYPELYDCDDIAFKDYTRKSYVWNAIATTLGDKATKLMKSWIIMQTRFEWEINRPTSVPPLPLTDLQKRLDFFNYYMLKNPDTVFKHSYYLKYAWHEPIDYFKDIYNLIVRMKKSPDIVALTDSLLEVADKGNDYQNMWKELANAKGNTPGQCETTWLIMRHFYWELMNMRQQNYQLTDKWYFETVITDLYEISKTSEMEKQKQQEAAQKQQQQQQQVSQQQQHLANIHFTVSTEQPSTSNKRQKTQTRPKSRGAEIVTQMTPTIINNMQAPSLISPQQQQQGPLPKITGAMSLAPQAFTGAPLQIRPVLMPPNNLPPPPTNLPPPPANLPLPPPPQILNGCLNTNMSLVTPIAPAPALHQTNLQMPMNLPQQTRFSAVSMPTLSSVRSLAPTTIIHAPTPSISVRSFASTNIRNMTPTNVPTIPQASLRNVRPPTAIRTPIINTSVSNTSSLISPLMPLTTMVNMTTTNTNNLPNYSTVPMNSQLTSQTSLIRPLAIATGKAAITDLHNMPANMPGGITNNTNLPMSVATPTPPPAISPLSQPPLPKISAAVSLLNPNEILIELIASQNGNHLVVHGPPLSDKYQLSMPTVAKFIREILAIPLLHNKRHNQPQLINSYWEHISLNFQLPAHICRACWNFLVENFNHFPQIAPLKDLMAPFRTSLNVWKESFSLFKVFDDHCVAMGWLQHMDRLPEVVDCISGYPVLYQDVGKESLLEPNSSHMETLCAWRTLRLRFPKIHDIQDIWVAIKNCFCQYMSDLEFGIDNKWPINWWRSLARLKFLVDARYDTNEPYYYIVSNKMVEEIEKCAMQEMKARYNKTDIPLPKIEPKKEDMSEQPTVAFEWSAAEPVFRKDVETVALLTAVQKHPVIYGKADYVEKYEAWKQVAKELQMEVPDCLLAFRHATKNYCSYKKQDPVTRCRLNHKYYKKLDEIFRNMSSLKTKSYFLNIKTPTELNQSVEPGGGDSSSTNPASEFVFPERYISDISMSNSDSNLVVKNWTFALGNLQLDDTFHFRMRDILKKYLPDN